MVRTKYTKKLLPGCLALLFCHSLLAQDFYIGRISQIKKSVTSSTLKAKNTDSSQVMAKDKVKTGHVYRTQADGHFSIQLFDGGWVRLNPNTEVSFQFDAEDKTLTIKLYKGSLKAVVTKNIGKKQVEKVKIESDFMLFETSESKFSIASNELTEVISAFVEKGVLIASKQISPEKTLMIHRDETISLNKDDRLPSRASKMTEYEIKFVKENEYLKEKAPL